MTTIIERFRGEIIGVGTTSGHRLVIGRWPVSPFGTFADVMHEAPDGVRTLLAPTDEIAEYIAATYQFDEIVVVDVRADRSPGRLLIDAGDLSVSIAIGTRTALGVALRLTPEPIATARWWCAAIDPIAHRVLRGVRTCGTAGNGRREWYGATDQHGLHGIEASLAGEDLGRLAAVDPPVRFGFSSTPPTPSVVAVTTSVRRESSSTPPER